MRVTCFTSFTLAYLPRARVLAASLRAAHPDWRLAAILVDRAPPDAVLDSGFDEVIEPEALGIPDFAGWMFRHDLVEACTAVKGRMLLRLLAGACDAVVYLDPDIAVFHGLHAAIDALATASVVLTPHQIAANDSPAAIADNEAASQRYGVFNLGFLAVRRDEAGLAFAAWWAGRLDAACYDDPDRGLFTDQRHCDLAPALFDGVRILRDPGSNVASWNLSRRRLAFDAAGDLRCNGALLGFYHFSKVDGPGLAMTTRYAAGETVSAELLAWYRRRLATHAAPGLAERPWHYGSYRDGVPIPRAARLAWRDAPDAAADPFAAPAG